MPNKFIHLKFWSALRFEMASPHYPKTQWEKEPKKRAAPFLLIHSLRVQDACKLAPLC